MALVWIPPLLRDLTAGTESVDVPGASVCQVVAEMEQRFPGVSGRLCPGGVLRTGIAVIVDGQAARFGLLEAVGPNSEVHFLPAVAGG